MSIQAAKESFFKSGHYAVVGASKDRTKYGNKVSERRAFLSQKPTDTLLI